MRQVWATCARRPTSENRSLSVYGLVLLVAITHGAAAFNDITLASLPPFNRAPGSTALSPQSPPLPIEMLIQTLTGCAHLGPCFAAVLAMGGAVSIRSVAVSLWSLQAVWLGAMLADPGPWEALLGPHNFKLFAGIHACQCALAALLFFKAWPPAIPETPAKGSKKTR
jgi:hypothetical protein